MHSICTCTQAEAPAHSKDPLTGKILVYYLHFFLVFFTLTFQKGAPFYSFWGPGVENGGSDILGGISKRGGWEELMTKKKYKIPGISTTPSLSLSTPLPTFLSFFLS